MSAKRALNARIEALLVREADKQLKKGDTIGWEMAERVVLKDLAKDEEDWGGAALALAVRQQRGTTVRNHGLEVNGKDGQLSLRLVSTAYVVLGDNESTTLRLAYEHPQTLMPRAQRVVMDQLKGYERERAKLEGLQVLQRKAFAGESVVWEDDDEENVGT